MALLLAQPALGLVDEALDVLGDLPAVHFLAEFVKLLFDLAQEVRDSSCLAGAHAL